MQIQCLCVCVGGWEDECVPPCGCVQNWIYSYVNRQCMWVCICRRDPYHGIMRSATVGYPQTVVIMAAVKELMLKEGQTLTHQHIQPHTGVSPTDRVQAK